MIVFAIVAAVFVIGALFFVLSPLLRRPHPTIGAADSNLSVYRDQLAELDRDLRLDTLDREQYGVARSELQRRLLEDMDEADLPAKSNMLSNRFVAIAIGVSIPLLAGLLYWHLGTPQGIGAAKHTVAQASNISEEQFAAMTEQLAARMASKPDDPIGWFMLGRAYKALQRYPDAVKALEQANGRKPGDPQIMLEYAEAIAQANGKLAGEPRALIEQVLKIAPDDPKALTMAGGAAFEARDYAKAIQYWERLANQVPAESELGQALAAGLSRARAAAGVTSSPPSAAAPPANREGTGASATHASVRGEVHLADALKDKVKPDDTVFIYARAAQGPRMPLAILRKQVKDLPAHFKLDDSMAMNPQMKLSSVDQVVVTARVSRSGTATPASGDLQGETAPLKPDSAQVNITIDRVVP